METITQQQRPINIRERDGVLPRELNYEFVLDGSLPAESLGNYVMQAADVRTGFRL